MRLRFSLVLGLFAAFPALAAGLSPTFPSARPGGIRWKARITVEGPRGPIGEVEELEYLMRGGKLKIETTVRGKKLEIVRTGDTVYQWEPGARNGLRLGVASSRPSVSPDYALRLEELKAHGAKVRTEKVDGHRAEVFELPGERGGKPGRETVWIARDWKFPVRYVVEVEGVRTTTVNRDVETDARISDADVSPPADVQFRDMATVIHGGPPPH